MIERPVPKILSYAAASIAVAIAVLGLKAAAYAVTGSIALLSDALESIINLVVSITTLLALRVSLRPADINHPFGHHKAEYLSSVLEGALIVVAALEIFREAYFHIFEPVPLAAPGLGIALNILASALNAVWGFRLLRVGHEERSPALVADARHVLADVISSAAVVGGVLLAVLTGWLFLDGVIAAAAGLYILLSGWRLLKESVGGLMDEAADRETMEVIKRCIAAEGGGAIEAHDLQTRHAGPVTFVQFHLVVPASMTVSMAHDICDRIEAALRAELPAVRISIHVEPENKVKHAGIQLARA
jgi:cation diffusion facilitator family transporter